MFSVIIPSFNNLEYLKLCISSLEKNSSLKNELIFYINEGSDGSLDFIKSKKYKFIYSEVNQGLCTSVNEASKFADTDYILYAHDDMYFLPEWDLVLKNELNLLDTCLFYLSGTMINEGHIKFDCGKTFKDFDERKLLLNYKKYNFYDYQGSHWAPHLIHKSIWEKIKGFSEEFNPGDGSDPDLTMKLWNEGVRIFKGINDFKVYHFGSITLRKKENFILNKGDKIFLKKWKITPRFFRKHYLRGFTKFSGPLSDPKKNITYFIDLAICKLKLLTI